MRTTLTLDDDVAAKLKAEAARAGRPFREVVNETLRRGIATRKTIARRKPFKVAARDLGEARWGGGFDNVAVLIEQLEGPYHR